MHSLCFLLVTPLILAAPLYTHLKLAVANVPLAKHSLNFPAFLPLLFAHQLSSIRSTPPSYTIQLHPPHTLTLKPLRLKLHSLHASAFLITHHSSTAFPLPLTSSVIVARLYPKCAHFAVIHLWHIIPHPPTSSPQLLRFKLLSRAILHDISDNIQRTLGPRACPGTPSISGICNNRRNPVSGVTHQPFLPAYPGARPHTHNLISLKPSARTISNLIFKGLPDYDNPNRINALLVFFGQFIDHEIVATPAESLDNEAAAPIQKVTGTDPMSFTRSAILRFPYSSCCQAPYPTMRVWDAVPVNALTSFIDAGAVYGSDNLRAVTLRTWHDGKLILKSKFGELHLPRNTHSDLPFVLDNENDGLKGLFAAGDVRANENPVLLSIHTLFAREHNRVCNLIRSWIIKNQKHHLLSDDWLYKHARLVVIAQLQTVTFYEFANAMLGGEGLGKWKGYRPDIDARVNTLHAAVAYRWGHSAIPEQMTIKKRTGQFVTKQLKQLFFSTDNYETHGLSNLIKAAMDTPAKRVDLAISESLRNFLFHKDKAGVLDLVALNIQRARDFGVPGYLKAQRLYKTGNGLENIDPKWRRKLLQIYKRAENIDAFTGGLAERTKEGSMLGPLFHAINLDQFKRIRDGDRFYYENIAWHKAIENMPLVKKIRMGKITFKDIIIANTKLTQDDFVGRGSAFETREA